LRYRNHHDWTAVVGNLTRNSFFRGFIIIMMSQ
jgi:hypothetical protein